MRWYNNLSDYFKSSIMGNVFKPVLILSILTCGYIAIYKFAWSGIATVQQLPFVSSLTIVVGFLLVFRTNTAYDRFWEGRKLWSNIILAARNLGRLVWIEVLDNQNKGDQLIAEKIESLRAILQFAHSLKNSLRAEINQSFRENSYGYSKKSANYERKKSMKDSDAELGNSKTEIKENESTTSSIPLNILSITTAEYEPLLHILTLTKFVQQQKTNGTIEGAQVMIENQINLLVDAMTGCERISRTPIPRAYAIHLHQIVYLYLIVFPMAIVRSFEWLTLPISFIVYFVFIGVLKIGEEIENPFGVDYNDLPLEKFCEIIERELLYIIKY